MKRRRSIRLEGYDYALPGAYFITICTHQRRPTLGRVVEGKVLLSSCGTIAARCWGEISVHFPHVETDEWVVMPNHVHAIIWIVGDVRPIVGAQHAAPLQDGPTLPRVGPGSLAAIVRSFKSAVTRSVNRSNGTPGTPLWQRGFYDHIVRSERALDRIRDYIISNPALWALDAENPAVKSVDAARYYRSIWRP